MGIQGRITVKAAIVSLIASFALSAFASDYEAVPGEYIVKLKEGVSFSSKQALSANLKAYVKSEIPRLNVVVVQRPTFELSASAIEMMAANSNVEIVEPNYIYRVNRLPNDPSLGRLWGLVNVGQTDGRGTGIAGMDIDAERAWDITTGSENVLIAVIDTGIDYTHPDLQQNIWQNQAEANGEAGVDDDGNGFIDDIYGWDFTRGEGDSDPIDDHGHGTHCAGTIGARGDDGAGIVGVNWQTKLMGVKFLGADGSGTLEGALRSIDYATLMGAKVLSNSWGGGGPSETLREAIVRSHEAGAVFVAAAGNSSSNNDERGHYPSNYDVPNVISVAALDNKGQLASFSNYGKRTVHVAAPGVNVYSSILRGEYASWSGTSMATPHVSGIVGLLLANEPNLTNVEIKERLISTIKPISGIKSRVKAGGITSAYNALTNTVAPPDPNDPANWSAVEANASTPHPYAKKSNLEFVLEVAGAQEMALYFQKFDTERGYDKVSIFDRNGNKVAELSGNFDDSYSPVISGDYARVVFTSDDSVERYGFDITKVAYR